MAFDTKTYVLPAYWASYLINGDASGIDDSDRQAADRFLAKNNLPSPVDVGEQYFARRNDAGTLAGDVAEYTFLIPKKKNNPARGLRSRPRTSLRNFEFVPASEMRGRTIAGFGKRVSFKQLQRSKQRAVRPRTNPALPYRKGCQVRVFKNDNNYVVFVKQPGHWDQYNWSPLSHTLGFAGVESPASIAGSDWSQVSNVPDNLFRSIKSLFCK